MIGHDLNGGGDIARLEGVRQLDMILHILDAGRRAMRAMTVSFIKIPDEDLMELRRQPPTRRVKDKLMKGNFAFGNLPS